ncbi:sigma factor-like helix-turn-helix DNA-binding protein [Streptomyces uncialis]|uniref:sigma factor-like helix-turn-helix DNA-binding protein n=1 Tax=Streptomyces uncialis TaxID=1048205 RepID=UPI0037A4DF95
MRTRHTSRDARREREFAAFVAGAAPRLLHTAALLTAEPPDAPVPRARALLTHALAHTYADWDGLRGDDPYDHARGRLVTRYDRDNWHPRAPRHHPPPAPGGVLAALGPRERLVLVLRLHEGVAEEQIAALLGLSAERVRVLCARAVATVLGPRAGRGVPGGAVRTADAGAGAGAGSGAGAGAGAGGPR